MKRLALAAFAALAFLALVGTARAWDVKGMNAQIDQTNVLLNEGCSGTVVAPGYVLTANHCIDMQFRVIEQQDVAADGTVTTKKVRIAAPGTFTYITFKDGHEVKRDVYVYDIVQSDADTDLALVKAETLVTGNVQAKLACAEPVRGDQVYAVGNSFAVLYATLTKGIVSSTDRTYAMLGISASNHRFIQMSAPIAPGNSGGALYNDNGELVGVNVRGGISGFAVAVPLADIKDLLAKEKGLGTIVAACK